MKLTKHQKMIINRINKGEIYDIYSYLKSFGLIKNFILDKEKIEHKFNVVENGRKYKVLKVGIYPSIFNSSDEDNYEEMPAVLDFENLKKNIMYKDINYNFDLINGVEIAESFDKIREFLTIWSFLCKELLALELPKKINSKEIGLFFRGIDKQEKGDDVKNKYVKRLTHEVELNGVLKPREPLSFERAIKIDALKFTNKDLEFDDDLFLLYDSYLDKKILATPELEIYIKRHYITTEEKNFILALIPAYLSIFVSLLIAFMQKPDNSEVLKIQNQLEEIHTELLDNQLNTELDRLITSVDDIGNNLYKGNEVEKLLDEIKSEIKKIHPYSN